MMCASGVRAEADAILEVAWQNDVGDGNVLYLDRHSG